MSISKKLLGTAFVLALAVAGCDDDEPLNTGDAGRDATVDVPRDTVVQTDTPRPDTAADTAVDASDARLDTATDLRPDTATDLRADTGTDVLPNLDVSADVSVDAADAGADAADGGDAAAGG
ncbi:MAG TPA: hypothetical protein VGF45_10310 [Polyangia bacterium]